LKKINVNTVPQLHLGPMSKNVITAVSDFAVKKKWPICLIASRRQIDGEFFGGGYVYNLTTENFSKKNILDINKEYIIFARDHGGPYQGKDEDNLSEQEAIRRSLKSFEIDVVNGLKIIHIDPQKCIKKFDEKSLDKFIDLTKLLLKSCYDMLDKYNINDVDFEVGSDEGICMQFSSDDWKYFLGEIFNFNQNLDRKDPISLACPLGTKVQEIENTGSLFLDNKNTTWLNYIERMVQISKDFKIKLKLHNADYVSNSTIKMYMKLGIEQFNIAPELGAIETLSLVRILKENNLNQELQKFYDLSLKSKKWERWLKDNSVSTNNDKSIISGHYIFATNEFISLRKQIDMKLEHINLDKKLKLAITNKLNSYYEAISGK